MCSVTLAAVVSFCGLPPRRDSAQSALLRPAVTSVPEPQATPTSPADRLSDRVGTLATALSRCGARIPETQRRHIAQAIHQESQRYGYDPWFVLAMIEIESTCAPRARSRRGALGLIQMKPSTARAVAKDAGLAWHGAKTLTTPVLNVQLALHYLSQLEKQFHDPHLALAAYNLGPQRAARMSRHRARQLGYVRKILTRYDQLLTLHAVAPVRSVRQPQSPIVSR